MSVSDAIVVGEAWISEHFFTTEAKSESFQARVLARRKAWDAEDAEGRLTVRSRFTQARQGLEVDLAALGEQSDDALAAAAEDVHTRLLDVLGFTGHGLRHERTGPVIRISAPGITEGAPLVVVVARPVEAVEDLLVKDERTLLEPFALHDDAEDLTSAARLLSALFVADDAPAFALVLAGRWALLAERERWAEGRYLAVDVQLVCERNGTQRGGEVDRALTCLSAESVAPDADGDLWWHSVLEESVKHTVGVSQDLRDGVRFSIEIIANEVVRRRAAQGLAPLPADRAQPLAKQSLRFLYRILFLLYAEASPELGVLPVGAPEYAQGYSLDRLRELVQVELATPQARSGTHLYDSLGLLFRLVDQGHAPTSGGDEAAEGLEFNPLRADLFRPEATAHIDEVGLGNVALQEVLRHLLLSKESHGKDRGFISYAELGINQLGAVYEGLMSYTGFFAETDLHEVAKNGDSSKGSWVVPVDRAEGIESKDFVTVDDPRTGERKPVVHYQGEFVFRLAGRERQQSASYYTPEVLTRFTVGQALEELLDQEGRTTPASEILDLTVCEPALGSGAFAIEAVRQLAEQYLKRRQKELGEQIDPDEYPRELQRVKAYLALHNVYGVDLNSTAVELAEISLWLDTMVQGLDAPWFGLHLRRGNSLIGARRAVFRRDQVTSKAYLKDVPKDVPMTLLAADVAAGRLATDVGGGVHHFLLPAAGWGSSSELNEAKRVRDLAPDNYQRLITWRKSVARKPSKSQVDALVDLAYRVESLWQIASQRLEIAEREVRRAIPVWGADALPSGGAVRREQIEEALRDASGAHQRLRRVMDAWCALWFWPLTDTLTTREVDGQVERIHPPSLDQWIGALQMLLGRHAGKARTQAGGDQTLSAGTGWDELNHYEDLDRGFASATPVERVLEAHPWLRVCEAIAGQQGFFHWELDFATVLSRGGFDLQAGNPPWVRPRTDQSLLLAESDPWWQLSVKPSQRAKDVRWGQTTADAAAREIVLMGIAEAGASLSFVGDSQNYPHLAGLQPDLYRCFMEQAWRHASQRGTTGLIHPETHFTDEKAGHLRGATYSRLRRHWQFINELRLFEIHHLVTFGAHVYGSVRAAVSFRQATALYHPDTVERSLAHDGSGQEPGLKDPDGNWDLRPHRGRIVNVDEETLATWHAILEGSDVPVRRTRMVYAVNRSTAAVLDKLSRSRRIGELGLDFSRGWDESRDRRAGRFETRWGAPDTWDDVILQGPHLHVATPLYKTPNKTMLHNLDWSATDFEALPPDAIPVTAYKPAGDRYEYDCAYTEWGTEDDPKPARDYYRVAWRRMAANTGERTLTPAFIPPGSAHVDGVFSAGGTNLSGSELVRVAGVLGSLVSDMLTRTVPKGDIRSASVARLPFPAANFLDRELVLRVIRLNAVTEAYGPLWSETFDPEMANDEWTGGLTHRRRASLSMVGPDWVPDSLLRAASDRRQAIVEIDALVALMLDITANELCTIYRTQFPVLYGYDRNVYFYDANGRLVPNSVLAVWRKKGDRITEEERTAVHPGSGIAYTYELPYVTLDREADMRQAYAEFERRLAERL